eukprot:1904808-Amphidinium_carterae.2
MFVSLAISRYFASWVGRTSSGVAAVGAAVLVPALDAESVGYTVLTWLLKRVGASVVDSVK